ncbi:BACON domain-containing protein [Marinobacter bohaiensis]|uniref:BACON domain-containing protein n=1 Tax=Marinobacter bohaiensis TaxID=2201898 RepID=UPI0013A6E756|nr:fibronectin type III domain-containing protein [Marinobacter bohaiensis]
MAVAIPARGYQVMVADAADRSGATPLDGLTLNGTVYIFLDQDAGPDQVRFRLDGVEVQVENNPPWDFAGTTPDDQSLPFDTLGLANGSHTIAADVRIGGSTSAIVRAQFVVDNAANQPEEGDPAPQFHTGWRGDPATSLTVAWQLPVAPAEAEAQFRVPGAAQWQSVPADVVANTDNGALLEAELDGLSPATRYELRVSLGGGVMSAVYSSATLPGAGPQDFDVLYVADTGLVGRDDGLATGTEQVILEMAALMPDLVLLGGDYAYFDTDKRYGTLERSIGAWFEQMQPLLEFSPAMPSYGNHEVLLGEGFAPWAAHFPTPEGWNGRRMYSFDAGEAHFVSVFGVDEFSSLPAEALAWLDADLAAARAAGQRWLIPFFHAAPFSDGANHPAATTLRAQLGPIFEAHGVTLALTSHDQSFERTLPLTDVPASNTPTSNSRTCYEPDDGVTWIKVSPGGKLSNISGGFSPWRSAQPPYWTAIRDNTAHHFARLRVRASGELVVQTWAVTGTGEPAILQDQFRYTTNGCGAEFTVDPDSLVFELEPGESASQTLQLSSTGEALAFVIGTTPDWLTVSPGSGTTPATLTVSVAGDSLPSGTQLAQIPIRYEDGEILPVPVHARVGPAGYTLLVSAQPDRSTPVSLEGAALNGWRYVFLTPPTDVRQVRFYLDNPTASGSARQTENQAPFDFAGTETNNLARPFDTATVADGAHSITAQVITQDGDSVLTSAGFSVGNFEPQLSATPEDFALTLRSPDVTAEALVDLVMTDGSQLEYTATSNAAWLNVDPAAGSTPQVLALGVDASDLGPGNYQGQVTIRAAGQSDVVIAVNLAFDVANPYELQVSQLSNRDNAVLLAGQTLSGTAYVFVPDVSGIEGVRFFLDDPERLGSPIKIEGRAPWDFAGTDTGGSRPALPYDFSQLSGSHQITAEVDVGDEIVVVTAGFVAGP